MTATPNFLSNLRWKLALFIFSYIHIEMCYTVFTDIHKSSIYSSWFSYSWGEVVNAWNNEDPDDRSLALYCIAVLCWLPISCITYFLLTTYYSQFPEALI